MASDQSYEAEPKPLEFLRYLYEQNGIGALNLFDSRFVGNALGCSEDESVQIVRQLYEEGLIELRATSGKQHVIRLTPQGRKTVEIRCWQHAQPATTVSLRDECSETGPPGTDGLTSTQRADYEQQKYRCRDQLCVTGTFDSKGRNVVVVNNGQVLLGPRQLHLLLIFVSAAKSGEGNWVDPDELIPLHFDPRAPRGGKYQPLSRLRDKLRPALESVQADLFEKGFDQAGTRRYRLSTHPDFITYEKEKLLQHPDEDIKRIAGQLK
jgi:DNA-binding MarR family transcriptional regulator